MTEGQRLQDIKHKSQSEEERVFGSDAKRHPVTKMLLQQGSGRMPDSWQARNLHIPYIRDTQGDKQAELMLLALDEYERASAESWAKWREEKKSEAAEIARAALGKK